MNTEFHRYHLCIALILCGKEFHSEAARSYGDLRDGAAAARDLFGDVVGRAREGRGVARGRGRARVRVARRQRYLPSDPSCTFPTFYFGRQAYSSSRLLHHPGEERSHSKERKYNQKKAPEDVAD